jgi:hypothetical protein
MRSLHLLLLATALAVAVLAGCGSDHGTNPGFGTVRISMTDAPGDYDAVNVVVREVHIHPAGDGEDAGWLTVRPPADTTIDLLSLTNGGFVTLGSDQVPAGTYDQVRLVLGNGSTIVVGGTESPLTVPSGMQSGIKVKGTFTVPAGGSVDVGLDFDAAHSIHRTGNGRWMMNPVIRLVVLSGSGPGSGAIAGQLDPATDATVYATIGADTIASTTPVSDGHFKLSALPPGTYAVGIDIVSGYRDTTLTGVGVAAGDTTQLGIITLTPQ